MSGGRTASTVYRAESPASLCKLFSVSTNAWLALCAGAALAHMSARKPLEVPCETMILFVAPLSMSGCE